MDLTSPLVQFFGHIRDLKIMIPSLAVSFAIFVGTVPVKASIVVDASFCPLFERNYGITKLGDVFRSVCARLGADVVRYSFTAMDFHHLLLAGLPAHTKQSCFARARNDELGYCAAHWIPA